MENRQWDIVITKDCDACIRLTELDRSPPRFLWTRRFGGIGSTPSAIPQEQRTP